MRFVSMMSDSTLIQAHQAGDPCAISTLMERHQNSLMGMLINRVGSDAEDLFQETWVRVSNNLNEYDDRGSFKAWLFQIARRLVIDHYRRKKARIHTISSQDKVHALPVSRLHPEQGLMAADVHAVFLDALAQLDEATAEVVRMRLEDHISFKEIAAHQGVSINTALGRMHRGLKRIRASLIAAELIESERTS